jgi:hypothetical protein
MMHISSKLVAVNARMRMTVVEPKRTSQSIFPLSLWERAGVRVSSRVV